MKRLVNAAKLFLYQHPRYYAYYKRLSVEKNTVLLESTHGKTFGGHLFYLLKELDESHPHLNVCVVVQDVKKTQRFLENHGLGHVLLIKHLSNAYLKRLATSQFLLNDTSFYSFFIKKPGQTYFNFWHGTPLKTLGQDMKRKTDAANVQRNFYMTDKIVVSNDFTAERLIASNGLARIYSGEVVVGPSPRNGVLLDLNTRDAVRKKLDSASKNIVFYLPTWRGQLGAIDNENDKLHADFHHLAQHLSPNDVLYVKLHPFSEKIDLSAFSNVHPMPECYELYEFLTAVDTLITDYSSVMYDFALTKRSIILYTYDKEKYASDRGFYDDIDRYPFLQVQTVDALLRALQNPQETADYTSMISEFCPFDVPQGAKNICDYLFNPASTINLKVLGTSNQKETAFILSGGFWDNGVTMALLNTFDHIDLEKRNYVVLLGQKQLEDRYAFRVDQLQDAITFYPFPEGITAGILDRFLYLAYLKFEKVDAKWIRKRVANLLQDDYKRITGDLVVDHFVHFTGFGSRYSELIKHVPKNINTVMYAHTNMIVEYEAKKSFNKKIIFSAYEHVNKVAIVHQNLKTDLIAALPDIEPKLHVMNNFLGEARVRQLAKNDFNVSLAEVNMEHGKKDDLRSDIENKSLCIFINIGRFDYEKGHDRFIAAFEKIYAQQKQTRLVIVAPHGPLREQTLDLISNSSAAAGIYVLGRMSNPYALLARCDCFVLSSYYEGLGLVVYEALALRLAVVTVDLTETVSGLQNGEAIVVAASIEGLYDGMKQHLENPTAGFFDFSSAKKRSDLEFEALFKRI